MSDDKGSSPPCGIYLQVRDVTDKIKTLTDLRQVAMVINRNTEYKHNMHMVMFDYVPLQVLALRELVEAMRMSGIVAITDGGQTGFESCGADGVLVRSVEEIAPLRTEIGAEAIIGLDARMLKMEIKELALVAADFVILPADVATIAAWTMLTDKPCVVRGRVDNDNCGDYAAAGASFVDVSDYVFKHKKGVMQGTVNVMYALGEAIKKPASKN